MEDKIEKAFFTAAGCIFAGIIGLQYLTDVSGFIKKGIVHNLKPEKIEETFVDPNKLEFKLTDYNRNGADELIVKFEGQGYLVRKIDGKLTVQPYEVKPKYSEKLFEKIELK